MSNGCESSRLTRNTAETGEALKWSGYWNLSPVVEQMWAEYAAAFAPEGVLEEVRWRGPTPERPGSVAMRVGVRLASHLNPDSIVTSHGGGFLHTLPMRTDEELNATRAVGWTLPWNAPALMGLIGHPPENPDCRKILIAYEWPVPYLFVIGPSSLPKQHVERFHLDQYRTDHLLATGRLPYASEPEATTPPWPDFVFDEPHGRVGLDCAQFSIPSRRSAHGSFKNVRQALVQQPRHLFTHLAGMIIYSWFPQGERLGLAFRSATKKAALDEVVSALGGYRPDRNRLWIEGSPPDPHPGWDAVSTGGITFYGVPLEGLPPTLFFNRMGFELGMAYGTTDTAASGRAALQKLLADHDKEGFDHLLVTIGGPDRDGLGYLAEELLASEMLREPLNLVKPHYLSKVIIHFWETGKIAEVTWQQWRDASVSSVSLVTEGIRPTGLFDLPLFADAPSDSPNSPPESVST